jgi:hypothetical protein
MSYYGGPYIAITMVYQEDHTYGVWNLTPKILNVVFLTKNTIKMLYDEMQFDAPVSSNRFFNLRNVATSRF